MTSLYRPGGMDQNMRYRDICDTKIQAQQNNTMVIATDNGVRCMTGIPEYIGTRYRIL